MTIEEVIVARLVDQVTAVGNRVHGVRLPQAPTYPCLSYFQVGTVVPHLMGSDPNVETARWQVDAWGSTYASAKTVADAVTAALSRYRATVSGIVVMDVFKDYEMDLFDPDAQVFHVTLSFTVFHAN